MRRLGRRGALGAMLALASAACSPLLLFNGLTPKDGGTVRLVHDAAFAPGPRGTIDIYAPKAPGRYPIIVFLYGGSWNSGTKQGYAFVGRALAAQGFVVAIPDYRLVPEVRFPDFLRDHAAAVRWVRVHAATLHGDPDRLVLAGHSAGAYGAAMLAVDPQWLGADRRAVRGWIGLAGPYDFLPLDQPVTEAAFGGAPDLRATQPLLVAIADTPPALLATGDDDTLVRPRNSDRLAERLTSLGVTVERRRYAKLGHVGILTAIARPLRGRAPVLADMVRFASRVTR
jgi:acetyl esterase/lipase